MDLQVYIDELTSQAEAIKSLGTPVSQRDTAKIKAHVNSIQTACQHIFTECKALNRVLPQA